MILFKQRFVEPILARTKTVTRRGLNRRFKVGSLHQAFTRPPWKNGAPFAGLRILSVRPSPISEIDDAEAVREGFISLDDWRSYIGDLAPHVELLRIEFELEW